MRIPKSKSVKTVDDIVNKCKLAHKIGGHFFRVQGNVIEGSISIYWTNAKKKPHEHEFKVSPAEFDSSFDRLTEVVHTLNETPKKK